MTDILIRGMEMPTGCASCDFAIFHADSAYHYCFWLKKVFIKPDARLKDCPLVELPPHGDLIDRDATVEESEKPTIFDLTDVPDFLREQPVIVPSNKEETELLKAAATAPHLRPARSEICTPEKAGAICSQ